MKLALSVLRHEARMVHTPSKVSQTERLQGRCQKSPMTHLPHQALHCWAGLGRAGLVAVDFARPYCVLFVTTENTDRDATVPLKSEGFTELNLVA